MELVKRYTVGEEIASAVTHGIGAGLSVAALVTLVVRAAHGGSARAVVAAAIYGASLFLLYIMSTLYHALVPAGAKRVFRVFDHTTIFVLIAGTYTPYALLTLRGALGWTVFGILWGLCALGVTMDAVFRERFHRYELLLYIAMGWCIVLAAKTVLANMALPGILLLVSGGLAYTVGIVFYRMKTVRYMHAVWHLFVLCGSVLQYFSVLFYVL